MLIGREETFNSHYNQRATRVMGYVTSKAGLYVELSQTTKEDPKRCGAFPECCLVMRSLELDEVQSFADDWPQLAGAARELWLQQIAALMNAAQARKAHNETSFRNMVSVVIETLGADCHARTVLRSSLALSANLSCAGRHPGTPAAQC